MQDLANNSCADSMRVIYSKPFGNRWTQITNQMNQKNNLPRSEFFESLTPDIKTLDDFLDAEEWTASAKAFNGAKAGHYGTLPPLPTEPLNSPAALSERRRAIRRADRMREVIGWAIVAAAVAALGFILL